jgi:hypothetical protein
LVLAFRAPGSNVWIDAEGTVARVVHGRRAIDYGASVALEFKGIDDQVRGLLRKQLLKCPPVLPKRALRVDYAATVRRIAGL